MSQEQTLSIIKPDAVAKGVMGRILSRFEEAGLSIRHCQLLQLSQQQAERFYAEHQGKSFYPRLIDFMTSGPVLVSVLEGEQAIDRHRQILGATDPEQAAAGSIRSLFGSAMPANAAHGSDAPASAKREIAFFFDQ